MWSKDIGFLLTYIQKFKIYAWWEVMPILKKYWQKFSPCIMLAMAKEVEKVLGELGEMPFEPFKEE